MPSAKIVKFNKDIKMAPCIKKGECILNLSNSLDVTNSTLSDSHSGVVSDIIMYSFVCTCACRVIINKNRVNTLYREPNATRQYTTSGLPRVNIPQIYRLRNFQGNFLENF